MSEPVKVRCKSCGRDRYEGCPECDRTGGHTPKDPTQVKPEPPPPPPTRRPLTGWVVHCPLCEEVHGDGICPGATNFGGVVLTARPSAEKLREVAALERIVELLGSIDDTLRHMADRDPRAW